MTETRTVAVCGATGRQGSAVTRSLLAAGWDVRALTRHPDKPAAQGLTALGAKLVTADMEQAETLRPAFDGAWGVFSLQNGMVSGFDHEEMQARNVAEAALQAGVGHLVYASAGIGETPTGVESWDVKRRVEAHMRDLQLPFTSIRPEALMELMTDRAYYPAVGTWRIWPRLTGADTPIAWISATDVGTIVAAAFVDPEKYIGKTLTLAADVRTLAEVREIYREVAGRYPRTFPLPMWLFDRFTRNDVTNMWRWLRTGTVELDTGLTRQIHPSAMTVKQWLTKTLHGE
jgi:uncharacterized protein YbjT (DUF2867 family)